MLSRLKSLASDDRSGIDGFVDKLRDKRFRKGFACPYCKHDKVIRHGIQNGRQRYRCHGCCRTFSDHTHTPFRGTRYPELWPQFMELMVKGYSIRKTAERLNVSPSTIFTWRHKVLEALKRMEPGDFDGLLEVDETYFLYSEKGKRNIAGREPRKRGGSSKFRGISREQVCVVVARDRIKQTHARVACMGPITKAKAIILLSPYVGSVKSICSDANGTWRVFSGEAGIDHKELNLKRKQRVIQRIYHIQNVNSFHARLRDWMHRFKGVATKFLDNYLTWFRFIDARAKESTSTKKIEMLLTACLPISPERYTDIRSTQLILP
jgi:transposase-like protein